mgnify:CR=1 FL=1
MTLISRRQFNKAAFAGAGAAALAASGLVRGARAEATLNFQSVWLNDPEFLGYMIGIDNGYYAAEGLTVNYMPGGPDVIPEGALLSGKADISLTNIMTTSKAVVEKGAPLVIIGTQYQKSPVGVISLASANINGPKDLIGKTVACPPLSQNVFNAILKIAGIAPDQLRVVPYTFDPTPLIDGQVDAVVDFVTQIPFLVEQKSGKKASSFLFWDYGLPLYVDLVVVTNVLPYFDDVQLMLALSNIAAMLAPGGVLLHNEARALLQEVAPAVGLPFAQSRHVVIATVRGAAAPLYDSVWIHEKRPGR